MYFGLCNGNKVCFKNVLCLFLSGSVNLLMIDFKILSNFVISLCFFVL